MNALEISQQQQDDARKHRAEDKAEADAKEKSAFARRVTVRGGALRKPGEGESWRVRNGNSHNVTLYLGVGYHSAAEPDPPLRFYAYDIAPCTQALVTALPPEGSESSIKGVSYRFASKFDEIVGGTLWPVDPADGVYKPLGNDWLGDDIGGLEPTEVKEITPCY
ncbi:hypothetical protein [Streptosporangium lutulentum]|uniref:Uncharacterized protein n=1 Tax=Streptosporangium lutulentum TaxID=1461250 RepID=A0ABT9QLD5_9ACTN|nr:hypothetical protein [Streptosporangium lutulentum]MDP9847561.1 hypothetical protein [Streptosporangium lutulentum]